jgi:predicted membrane protein
LKKKPIILVIVLVIIIAGLLDLRYEGLFFQLLPEPVQSYIADIL